ncbi:CBS domain-containing protein [Methanogenium sp. S4BF]|uniref:CBS domain-containing protein n=1 Tax=Methanogenium sp. S4BF TaxID=1789226 RepID=UPI002415B53C|nr:CBS domain-containing protein [Methanogenium sp. S4BF]WFN35406.1 CBS domain-containing protein [Methanogenium sp. S4BF]
MRRNLKNTKPADEIRTNPGKMNGRPVEFSTNKPGHPSEILAIGTSDVYSVPQTMQIIRAVEAMSTKGFRRLPVTDPGTGRLYGLVTAGDVVDLMGGGSKYNLVKVKHRGQLLSAINEPVKEIMSTKLETVHPGDELPDVVDRIVMTKTGGLPIVNGDDRLMGIITERDVLQVLTSYQSVSLVEDVMTASPQVITPDETIRSAAREMTRRKFRRLPVVSNDVLFGIVTAMDIMKYVGDGTIFEKMTTGSTDDVLEISVRSLMTGDLMTTNPSANVGDAARYMLAKGVGALPVIEDSRLVGIITEYDLVRALQNEL